MSQKRAARRAERRKTPRADARLSMRLEGGLAEAGETQIVTESQNISSSGVYCYCSHFLAPLCKVDLTIVLPKLPGGASVQELIKCEGIVVRCEATTSRSPVRQFELACMFSDLDVESRERIESFVTWRNLQALRAAARGSNGARGATRTRTSAGASSSRRKGARGGSSRRSVH